MPRRTSSRRRTGEERRPAGALEEYRAAYMLDPKNAIYKQNYERLLRQVKQ